MNKFVVLLLLFFAFDLNAMQFRPTEDSVKKLLEVSNFKKEYEEKLRQISKNKITQIKNTLKKNLANELKEKQISSKQTALIKLKLPQVLQMIQREISWKALETGFIKNYYDLMNQDEVNTAITYFKSPTGVAVIVKLPNLDKKISDFLLRRNQDMTKKISAGQMDDKVEIPALEPGAYVLTPTELNRMNVFFDETGMKADFEELLKQMAGDVENFSRELYRKKFTAEQSAQHDQLMLKTLGFIDREITWEKNENLIKKIYLNVFSKSELTRMMFFSNSPDGISEKKVRLKNKALLQQHTDNVFRMAVKLVQDLEAEFRLLGPRVKPEAKIDN